MALFTAAELQALTLGPVDRLGAALDGDGPDEPAVVVERFRRGAGRFIAGFVGFQQLLAEFLRDEQLPTDWQRSADHPAVPDAEAVLDHLRRGDAVAAVREFERFVDETRAVHALERDRVAAALTAIYRDHGVAELERSLRYVGARTLLLWMPTDIARDPHTRLVTWANMLVDNFAELTIEEYDDRFVLVQAPCGTCGRQVAEGKYDEPEDFAVVTEVSPVTFGRGETPVYRTHVAVMHTLMPMERLGVPWPVIQCPAGLDAGPCRVHLFKDPMDLSALSLLSGH